MTVRSRGSVLERVWLWTRALRRPTLSLGCPQNRFGVNCEHACSCRNGGLCDSTNGSCSCSLGWTGPHCELGESGAVGAALCVGWRVAARGRCATGLDGGGGP